MSIDAVIRGITNDPMRTIIYGVQGIGKSTFAAASEKPIFIQTEDGLARIGVDRFPLSKNFDDVMNSLKTLGTEKHDYKTVVIDSLDWLERIIWVNVCGKAGKENIESFGYGKGYIIALDTWRRIIDALEYLRAHQKMDCILVAHAKIERFENPETDAYDRYAPRLHKSAAHLLMEWADNVLFANYRTIVKTTESGANKGIGTGDRIIRTTERPAHLAKTRLNLPDEISLDWEEYKSFFKKEETK